MTDTKLEPELPNLPPYDYFVELANGDEYGCWMCQTLRAYALSAIEADRNKRASAGSLTDEQRRAVSLFTCWWAMVEAERELIEDPIDPEAVVLHFMGSGASCMVHAKDLRELCALLSSVAPRVPEGFVLVPKEPTREMKLAADELFRIERNAFERDFVHGDTFMGPSGEAYYATMLAAAPQPTQEG